VKKDGLMMANNLESNKKIVETLVKDVMINHDLGKLDSYMRDDYIQHLSRVPQGKEGFRQFFGNLLKAIPDLNYSVIKMIAEEDMVMIYVEVTGTHTGGEYWGKAATGNKLNCEAVDIYRIEEGMIAEHWAVIDTLEYARQLGIIELMMEQEN
jgi:predicted SnoaL-like aldol condensation-catalyzing enzyme